MVAAASASSLVLPAAAAAYSSLSCAVFFSSLVPLLSQHTLATSVSAFLRGVFFLGGTPIPEWWFLVLPRR